MREARAHLADDGGVLALELVDGTEGLTTAPFFCFSAPIERAHGVGERARGARGAQQVASEKRARCDSHLEGTRVALDALVVHFLLSALARKKNGLARKKRMNERGRFHLHRAQVHLARGDETRALRHLYKCDFGEAVSYDDADAAADAYERMTHEEKIKKKEEYSSKEMEAAIAAAYNSGDFNEVMRLFVRVGPYAMPGDLDPKQTVFGHLRRAGHVIRSLARYETAEAAARKYAELTDTQLGDRKQNSLNKRDAHKSIKDAIVNRDHNKLFHLAVRMGGFDAHDLGAEYEQFGTGIKSVVHLIQSLARYESAEAAADAYEALSEEELKGRKLAVPLKLDKWQSAMREKYTAGDFNAVFLLAAQRGGAGAQAIDFTLPDYKRLGKGRESIVRLLRSMAKYRSLEDFAQALVPAQPTQAPQQQQSMQEQIRDGVRLRSPDAKAPQKPQSLQEQIRGGVKLKPKDERKLPEGPKVVAPGVSEEMQGRLAKVLAARRGDGKEDESDSDWEFGRIRMRRRKTHLH